MFRKSGKIFLSYSSKDRAIVEEIHLALRGAGHEMFFDRQSLPESSEYVERISKAIEDSDLLVFIVTPNSIRPGNFALTELKLAQRRWPHPESRVLPVRLNDTDYNVIPACLRAVTVLEPQGNVAAEVAHCVRTMIASGTFEKNQPGAGKKRLPDSAIPQPLFAAVVTLALGVVGILAWRTIFPPPPPDQLAYACPQLGRFFFNPSLGTAFGGVRPRIAEKEAVPIYSAHDGYGFWSYRQGANVGRRYYFTAVNSEM